MNDLLHELHASACLYARDLHRESGDVVAWEQCMAEKFAELLLQECIGIADKYAAGGAGSEFDAGYISCAIAMAEEIKKRFGVAEPKPVFGPGVNYRPTYPDQE